MGIKEQLIFPEIDFDKIDKVAEWILYSLPLQKLMRSAEFKAFRRALHQAEGVIKWRKNL